MLFTLLSPPYVQLHRLWEVVLRGGASMFPGAGGEGLPPFTFTNPREILSSCVFVSGRQH